MLLQPPQQSQSHIFPGSVFTQDFISAGKTSVFTTGTQQDIADRMTAANVTGVNIGDAMINIMDAVQIQMHKAGKTSAFDSMK